MKALRWNALKKPLVTAKVNQLHQVASYDT